ncbi:hypothetical protein Jiend_07240 [Micromonospora endophytica]|nr:hypothetical protein [Micromonospora endophytica]BCJ57302.1 hypothetical protein Jiend_07240 [Micromonospora endophytica]
MGELVGVGWRQKGVGTDAEEAISVHRFAYVMVATVLVLVGAAPASARSVSPPAAATAVESAAGQGAGTEVLSVRGTGPFRIGARLDRLTAAGLIDSPVSACAGVVHTGVVGEWAGVILLTFRSGRLVEVSTATAPPYSPAGAGVGMSFAQLETIYGTRGDMISNDAGTASGYLVRFGNRVELFTGHPIRPGVGAFQVGPASFVERAFRQGGPC